MWLNWVHCALRFVECELVQYDRNAPSTHTQNTPVALHTTNTLSWWTQHFRLLSRTFESRKYYAMHSLLSTCIVSNSARGPPKLHHPHKHTRVLYTKKKKNIQHHPVIIQSFLFGFWISLYIFAWCFIISFSLLFLVRSPPSHLCLPLILFLTL